MRRKSLTKPLLYGLGFVVLLGVLTAPAEGGLIVYQDPADDYIAFEAESFRFIDDLDNDGDGWDPRADAAASGGTYLHAVDSSGNTPDESEAVYLLDFDNPGTYRLYARHASTSANTASQDSFFRPADFGDPADVVASTNDDDTDYRWGYFQSYTVDDPADLLGLVEFRLGIREGNFRLDRIVLTQTDYGTSGYIPLASAAGLEALENSVADVPEPSTGVLCLSALLVLVALGRRRLRR